MVSFPELQPLRGPARQESRDIFPFGVTSLREELDVPSTFTAIRASFASSLCVLGTMPHGLQLIQSPCKLGQISDTIHLFRMWKPGLRD